MVSRLERLTTKEEVDRAIRTTEDKVLVLRFGKEDDAVCMEQDDILAKCSHTLSKMARICVIEADDIPLYVQYFDITLIPATVFFFNARHIKVDFRTQDHTKWIGAFQNKQDFIDLVEVIYKGGLYGKYIVDSPIPRNRVPQYEIFYQGI